MSKAYLLLGCNSGDCRNNFNEAYRFIENKIGKIISSSSLYETEPWGKKDQAAFLNQVLIVETALSPEKLLTEVLEVETMIGRIRLDRWAPRTIDVDILYYDNEIIVKNDLKIPHPQLHNRRFTLIPLNEIAPDHIHPVFNINTEEMLKRCEDKLSVIKLKNTK
ncbi:MAG: 2-amino-4-hydroxy-6-hydroxymethyldihydropteridine diphosphokinase [Cytophagaceae bacterium]|nr:2-amino-4-hydroxy-6-hydroxymethyldihydropteridine diphosphokinase [Cytophagaceae bacterium]